MIRINIYQPQNNYRNLQQNNNQINFTARKATLAKDIAQMVFDKTATTRTTRNLGKYYGVTFNKKISKYRKK